MRIRNEKDQRDDIEEKTKYKMSRNQNESYDYAHVTLIAWRISSYKLRHLVKHLEEAKRGPCATTIPMQRYSNFARITLGKTSSGPHGISHIVAKAVKKASAAFRMAGG